jgi:hypothetical protein
LLDQVNIEPDQEPNNQRYYLPTGIDIPNRVPHGIQIRIVPTIKPNRIGLHIPPRRRVVVAVAVVIEIGIGARLAGEDGLGVGAWRDGDDGACAVQREYRHAQMVAMDIMDDRCVGGVLGGDGQQAVVSHPVIAAIGAGIVVGGIRGEIDILAAGIGGVGTRQIVPEHPALAVIHIARRYRATGARLYNAVVHAVIGEVLVRNPGAAGVVFQAAIAVIGCAYACRCRGAIGAAFRGEVAPRVVREAPRACNAGRAGASGCADAGQPVGASRARIGVGGSRGRIACICPPGRADTVAVRVIGPVLPLVRGAARRGTCRACQATAVVIYVGQIACWRYTVVDRGHVVVIVVTIVERRQVSARSHGEQPL